MGESKLKVERGRDDKSGKRRRKVKVRRDGQEDKTRRETEAQLSQERDKGKNNVRRQEWKTKSGDRKGEEIKSQETERERR